MKKTTLQHFRDGMVALSLLHLFFILFCSWSIYLRLNGMETYMGFHIPGTSSLAFFLITGSSALSIALVFVANETLKIYKLEKELALAKANNEMSQHTIRILRSQRHDFLNHLQVIMGNIQLGKDRAALDYMQSINCELSQIRAVSGLEMPEIAVLLFIKKDEAMKHGITLRYNINHNLAGLKISQTDMVSILSNLIDNAIYELKKLPRSNTEKYITISFDQVGDTFYMQVNNYPGSEVESRVFEYGFTTKGREGSGIGLFNVKSIVEIKYRGEVRVKYDRSAGTSFIIAC